MIRLDRNATGVEFEDVDWELVPNSPMVRHRPTGTVFDVGVDAHGNGMASIFDFDATLVHVCPGFPVPPPDEVIKLGRAAIAVILMRTGVWKPRVVRVP
jgi:hypothetical protein